jgi:hypothetical protein
MGVGGQSHAPATLPPGMTRYPLYRRLGRPQCRSGRVPNISAPPGFDPQTVQLVASRYTDYAIPVFYEHSLKKNVCFQQKSEFWPAFLQFDLLCGGTAPLCAPLAHLAVDFSAGNWRSSHITRCTDV